MNDTFINTILNATGATAAKEVEVIQSLWSGYGSIARYSLSGSQYNTVIVKHVVLPKGGAHPRGWNTNLSHERKLKSYEVETSWYQKWAALCDDSCRIPHCLAVETEGSEVLIVLEDLDAAGYPSRVGSVSMTEMRACLSWLANFHVTYLHKEPTALWETGTYWHLETRPEELEVLTDKALKAAAEKLDIALKASPFQTFVHGDAKLANFCFSPDGDKVAAVDFQYVGGGCGMKDVAYFIGSCLYEDDCERLETQLLDIYFEELNEAVQEKRPEIDATALEQDWRSLYHVAWTDFHRFVKGWSPGHWKIHSYSERVAREVVANLS